MTLKARVCFGLALCLVVLVLICFSAPAKAAVLTLSDAELATQFASDFGSGTCQTNDPPGLGVEFYAWGITDKLAVSDKYPVSPLAGGTGPHNADFTAFSSYSLLFTNTGSTPVDASLYMNTGFTGTSGHPQADTFWGGTWITVPVASTVRAWLDFGHAETWNAWDDPVPEWRYSNGTWNPIFRLNEVTNIGFQFVPESGNEVRLVVSATPVPCRARCGC